MSDCGCDVFSDGPNTCRGSGRRLVVTRPKRRRSGRVAPGRKPSARAAPARKPSARAAPAREPVAPVEKPPRKRSARTALVRETVVPPVRRSKQRSVRKNQDVTVTKPILKLGTPSGDSTTDPTDEEQAGLTDKERAIADYNEMRRRVWGRNAAIEAKYW